MISIPSFMSLKCKRENPDAFNVVASKGVTGCGEAHESPHESPHEPARQRSSLSSLHRSLAIFSF